MKTLTVYDYREVSTHTLEGLKQAETLKAAGWEIYYTGLFLVRFRRART